MKFTVFLMFLTAAGFTSGQSTQEVRAHSGYTQDGQCSYTFVLPPSGVQHCGTGEGEGDLQQIHEQMIELQNKYQELRQENNALEQRLSTLEGNTENTTQPGSRDYLPSSCTEVAGRGGIHNRSLHVIDPDGPGRGVLPMVVQCDLQGQTAITLIGHDSEARTHVNGFEDPGSYSKDVTYWNSMEQMRALVDQSSLCKQLIKYECYGSLIWGTTGRP
ncbi:contactin-associated protein like 5-3-like [Branchiostoma floridae x Branchiostoma belcheri]